MATRLQFPSEKEIRHYLEHESPITKDDSSLRTRNVFETMATAFAGQQYAPRGIRNQVIYSLYDTQFPGPAIEVVSLSLTEALKDCAENHMAKAEN